MWILFTTANCPDVFLRAINLDRKYFAFFWIYLVLTLYLLNTVFLAVVYSSYRNRLCSDMKHFLSNRSYALKRAFVIVSCNDRSISADEFCRLFAVVQSKGRIVDQLHTSYEANEDEEAISALKERAETVLQVLRVDTEHGIDYESFVEVWDALFDRTVHFYKTRADSIPHTESGRRLAEALGAGLSCGRFTATWEVCADIVIASELCALLFQTVRFLDIEAGDGPDSGALLDDWVLYFSVGVAFTWVYAAEVIIKIAVLGWTHFWNAHILRHRLDVVVVVARVGLELWTFSYGATFLNIRLLMMVRFLRCIQLFRHVKPLRKLWTLAIRLVPAYMQLGSLLFLLFCVYATVGEQLFGGMIYVNNPGLAGTQFAKAGYFPMNFNDFGSAMMTLSTLMVVNNWYVIVDAYVRITSRASSMFFVSFFVLANLVVLNILVTLIIECFASTCDAKRASQERPGFAISVREGSTGYEVWEHRQLCARDTLLHMCLSEDEIYAAKSDPQVGESESETESTCVTDAD